ncbi:MAG: phosphatidylserine decarboxylase family protein [Deltaproteobacteria bacterium]|nr:phosphatidylserine decarboxylase family protein [Deltaproteobacteria bacterium]
MRIPIAREGMPFILAALICVLIVWFAGIWWLQFLFVPAAVFVIAFFRDPERAIPVDKDSIVSPADGRVIKVERLKDDRILKSEAMKISIFMNVFNVHVNRTPATGKVLDIMYNPGKFFNASLDKASLLNEQNALIMESSSGRRFAFNQIAGLIARRIVCHARKGMNLTKGQRFGLIRFGSRVDVYLPTDCRVSVKVGDKVRAGSSILGYWNVR